MRCGVLRSWRMCVYWRVVSMCADASELPFPHLRLEPEYCAPSCLDASAALALICREDILLRFLTFIRYLSGLGGSHQWVDISHG